MSGTGRAAGAGRRVSALASSALWALTAAGLAGALWLDHLLRRAGRVDLAIRAHELVFVAALAGMATVGALLARRRSRHAVGWLMLALALFVTVEVLTDSYARYGLLVRPGAAPAVRQVRALGNTFALWPACLGLILLLTPTGALPSRRWRWWVVITVIAPLLWTAGAVVGVRSVVFPPWYAFPNPYFVPAFAAPTRVIALPSVVVTLLGVVVGGASLVLRFRRARGDERQQLRWVASAAVVAAAAIPVAMVGIAVGSPVVVGMAVLGAAVVLCLAIAASILRYRLYDLDRVVSRTVAYGLLTLSLAVGYASVVLSIGQLVGRDSTLAVAGATLSVAAVFQPARRHIQLLVDRRFNRRSYDAGLTIAAFGARLRDDVDLEALRHDLLSAVHQTVQPTLASVWLAQRPSVGRLSRAGGRRAG